MSLPVVLTPEAEDELDEAAQWYEQQAAGLGVDLVAKVRVALASIGAIPTIHAPVYRDIRRAMIRRFPYSVFYRVHPDRIEVLAVFHNRRDPSIWQGRA
jgi:plasmid stabilization system protein ParE